MKSTTFSNFRNNAKFYFDAIEKGESVEVYRKGKLIAVVNPTNEAAKKRWKSSKPLKINGIRLSEAILAERKLS